MKSGIRGNQLLLSATRYLLGESGFSSRLSAEFYNLIGWQLSITDFSNTQFPNYKNEPLPTSRFGTQKNRCKKICHQKPVFLRLKTICNLQFAFHIIEITGYRLSVTACNWTWFHPGKTGKDHSVSQLSSTSNTAFGVQWISIPRCQPLLTDRLAITDCDTLLISVLHEAPLNLTNKIR